MNTKKCIDCEKVKSTEEFHKCKDGFQARCKPCKKELNAIGNPQRADRFAKKYGHPNNAVYAFKLGNEFLYVGESNETNKRLDFHYKNHSTFGKKVTKQELNDAEVVILWYGDENTPKEYRKYQEEQLIDLHNPKYNKK